MKQTQLLVGILLIALLFACKKEEETIAPISDCALSNLEVEILRYSSDTTYEVTLDFVHENTDPDESTFNVHSINNELLGYYKLEDLPLRVDSFPINGEAEEYVRVCMNYDYSCCAQVKFSSPEPCMISNLEVEILRYSSDTTYEVTLDFDHQNTDLDELTFNVLSINNELLGYYKLDDLPLRIDDFPISDEAEEYVRVCMNYDYSCCAQVKFSLPSEPCMISNLEAIVSGNTFAGNGGVVSIDCDYQGVFREVDLYVNNQFFWTYESIHRLPFSIFDVNLSWIGTSIRICVKDEPNCCAETLIRACPFNSLEGELLACTSDTTYMLTFDFENNDESIEGFDIYSYDTNGISWLERRIYFDTYRIADLPITIDDFPETETELQVIIVCPQDSRVCCKSLEFSSLNCGG